MRHSKLYWMIITNFSLEHPNCCCTIPFQSNLVVGHNVVTTSANHNANKAKDEDCKFCNWTCAVSKIMEYSYNYTYMNMAVHLYIYISIHASICMHYTKQTNKIRVVEPLKFQTIFFCIIYLFCRLHNQ